MCAYQYRYIFFVCIQIVIWMYIKSLYIVFQNG